MTGGGYEELVSARVPVHLGPGRNSFFDCIKPQMRVEERSKPNSMGNVFQHCFQVSEPNLPFANEALYAHK